MNRRRRRAHIIRPEHVVQGYVDAEREERFEPAGVDADDIAGSTALVEDFKRRGRVTRVQRRPHVDYYHGQQLDLIDVEMQELRRRQKEQQGRLSEEDVRRLRDLNEMMARIFREEREQAKLSRFEDMDDDDLEALLLEAAADIKAGS